ncbi:MAG TPA: GGDEF domain-containing protein, partial [Candidatus Baltobacteraceae bacterium]|nr:GGDEF domain-containing protein [Candidatus Baltobacteraceae bacterium]
YANALQVANVGALLVLLLALFVEERQSEFAPAIVMLGIFGSQFAFVRRRDLATVYAGCTAFLVVFAVYRGALGSTTLALMGTIVAAFAVAYATRSAHITTQLTLANERLRKDQTSHLDPLTGLQNRAVLFERLDGAIASAHRRRHDVALLYIDLNDFKQVNDTLGHRAGDDVLVQVGSRLKRAVRTDEVAARIGGDEFVVVLPHVERFNEPQEAAARIRRVLSDPYEVENRELRVGASIGVARSPYDGTDRDHLLGSADAAMYAEKRELRAAL